MTLRKHVVRPRTLACNRMSKAARAVLLENQTPPEPDRPRTRAECVQDVRPCPWVGCKWHLYLDVNDATGSIKLNFPDLEVWELQESCALDVADLGGRTLEQVGDTMNLTRERARQLERLACARFDREAQRRGLDLRPEREVSKGATEAQEDSEEAE